MKRRKERRIKYGTGRQEEEKGRMWDKKKGKINKWRAGWGKEGRSRGMQEGKEGSNLGGWRRGEQGDKNEGQKDKKGASVLLLSAVKSMKKERRGNGLKTQKQKMTNGGEEEERRRSMWIAVWSLDLQRRRPNKQQILRMEGSWCQREMERWKDAGFRERFCCRPQRRGSERDGGGVGWGGGRIQGRALVELQLRFLLRLTPVSHLESPNMQEETANQRASSAVKSQRLSFVECVG